jgi:hypothetical protein
MSANLGPRAALMRSMLDRQPMAGRGLLVGVCAAVLLGLSSIAHAGIPSGDGFVQVAFTGQMVNSDGTPISQEYQRVALNVVSVRLIHTNSLIVGQANSHWITIPAPGNLAVPAPTGILTSSLNMGEILSGTVSTPLTNFLQLEFATLQNLPTTFNGMNIAANTYNQVEVQLNSTNPGNVVPLCHSQPAGEGCVAYPVVLGQGAVLRRLFSKPYVVTAATIQPLVINIDLTVGPGPTVNPATSMVTLTPVITPQANGLLPSSTTAYNPALGTVVGKVTNFTSKTTVSAEFSGTGEIAATSTVLSSGNFVLNLPALATPNSTLYDFYVSGNGAYIVRSRVPVSSQGTLTGSPPETNLGTLAVPSSSLSPLSGNVYDACVGTTKPIQGATLQLLVPDTRATGSSTTCGLQGKPPAIPPNCVVVATAFTDNTGLYPLSASKALPQPFAGVPLTPPANVPYYDLVISASGYNTSVQEVEKLNGTHRCPNSGWPNTYCTFNLEHGYLAGTTVLSSPNNGSNPLNVAVMTEDSGTNNIENFTVSTIPVNETSGSFSMPVPDGSPTSASSLPVTSFDVFGAAQDLFQSTPQSTSGHSISVLPSIGAPDACATLDLTSALSPFDCVGLGSVYGAVSNANPGTTAISLSKDGVQLMTTEPNSVGLPPDLNNYNFCAPSDSYALTHYEDGVAESSAAVTLTTPTTVPPPCATICENAQTAGGSCLVCQPTTASTLP